MEGRSIQMTPQETKELVVHTWQMFCRGDIKGAFANMSDDVVWLSPGNLPDLSGPHPGKAGIVELMRKVITVFPEGLGMEIRKTYCDGNSVIIELIDFGKVYNGKYYENELCFVFQVKDGKICEIREYGDTQKVSEIIS
jgi:ketosteroid isomerase-like protein